MPKFYASFKGRKASDYPSWYNQEVEGNNKEEAKLFLQKTYSNIQYLKLSLIVKVSEVKPGEQVRLLDKVGGIMNVQDIQDSVIGTNRWGEKVSVDPNTLCYVIK